MSNTRNDIFYETKREAEEEIKKPVEWETPWWVSHFIEFLLGEKD